jgi:hypothetical protein
MRSSQPFPTIHGEVEGHDARSSSRAVSRSSIRSVVRLGPATGIRARKSGLLPHAREKLGDPRFQAKITSPSRLPLSRSRARRAVDPKVAARGRAGELKNHCLVRGTAWTRCLGACCQAFFRLDSRCFLHSTTSMGTPLDLTSPSTSRRTLSRNDRSRPANVASRGERNTRLPFERQGRSAPHLPAWLAVR